MALNLKPFYYRQICAIIRAIIYVIIIVESFSFTMLFMPKGIEVIQETFNRAQCVRVSFTTIIRIVFLCFISYLAFVQIVSMVLYHVVAQYYSILSGIFDLA